MNKKAYSIRPFPIPEHSLMLAPMEGITDEYYRRVIFNLYPEWSTHSCDFLRVPNITTNTYPKKHIIKHYGDEIYHSPELKNKTIYQILTSPNSLTVETVNQIDQLGFQWLDLNLGCPSKTVCKNQGGSFLLSDLPLLRSIIKEIRSNFSGTFTCKIRVGYRDDQNFIPVLKLLADEGVDAIKIHGRTRDQLYKGVANWDYIKKAVETITDIPIIGNGDIWTTDDVERFFDYTKCHSAMLARPALKTPWLARLFKEGTKDSVEIRAKEMHKYFQAFYKETLKQNFPEASRIKRLKSVSRYIFDDLPDGTILKKRFLLSKSFEEQLTVLEEIKKNHF